METVTETLSHEAQLGRAVRVATHLHVNQRDKGGKPYITHPLRVMADVLTATGDLVAAAVAVLHDVVEDCGVTKHDLLVAGFYDETVETVLVVTRHPTETYEEFIERVATSGNARAIVVKLADLKDNQDVTRLPFPITDTDRQRLAKYRRAAARLKAVHVP